MSKAFYFGAVLFYRTSIIPDAEQKFRFRFSFRLKIKKLNSEAKLDAKL